MRDVTVYLGPPGTGKTATLLARVKDELARGVPPERLAYVAFTRRAAREARERAVAELGLGPDDLTWWRTLHSTAATELGVGGQLVVGGHWRRLGEALGLDFSDLDEDGRPSPRRDLGHRVQTTYYLQRAREESPGWEELVWRWGYELAHHVRRFERTLAQYKADLGLYDYADLLDAAPGSVCCPEVVLLDEAQDLTAQQWAYFERLSCSARRVYVAGDDEQAIFGWAGADVARFLALAGRRVVLETSHRLPRAAYDVARRISDRIRVKAPKTWSPSARPGTLERMADPTRLDLGSGSWLLLARTRHALDAWARFAEGAAVRFRVGDDDSVREGEVRAVRAWERARRGESLTEDEVEELTALSRGRAPGLNSPVWHEALTGIPRRRRLYYEAVLRRRGQRELVEPARVRVDTVHGAKGAEADHVALLPDLTPLVERGRREDPDAEHRVWYVAVTRCRESLFVAPPSSPLRYDP